MTVREDSVHENEIEPSDWGRDSPAWSRRAAAQTQLHRDTNYGENSLIASCGVAKQTLFSVSDNSLTNTKTNKCIAAVK